MVLDRLLTGDQEAFLEINGLITRCLNRLRAYDFRDEWEDLRQDVVLAVVGAARAGRIREPDAFLAYLMTTTRNRVFDRIKAKRRHHEKDTGSWESEMEGCYQSGAVDSEQLYAANEVVAAIGRLPPKQRVILEGVYREGKTYEAVAADTGVPLGTMKRRLREGLAVLRQRFHNDFHRT